MLLGSGVVFILLAFLLRTESPASMKDFKVVYYPARCLIHHCDPYREGGVLRTYRAEGGDRSLESATDRMIATRYIYPPTAFLFTIPFAMLPWGIARILWMTLTAGSLVFASHLAWDLGADYAPIISGAFIGFLLANSEVLLVLGNPSGIAISLCVVAVWCFFRERFAAASILCLAVSLTIKPQDAGLVWLYFLLAGGLYRKRALQTLLVTIVLSLPIVLWVWHVSPDWVQELRANILTLSVHGGVADPGPASTGAHSTGMMINLQTVISLFRDDPRFYNPATYLILAPLLVVWAFVTVRSHSWPARVWLAIAAIAALSLLPVYHHFYDTKLLLLTVPACAMLWSGGGAVGRLAFLISGAGFVLTGDVSWAALYGLIGHLNPSTATMLGQVTMAIRASSVPVFLLIIGIFYLWVYARRSSAAAKPLV